MKNIKRIVLILFFAMVVDGVANAQPPTPSITPSSSTRQQHSINRTNTPIGTATTLLLTIAGGGLVYRIRKNKKITN